ncbi:MAG: enoyl-CoA hydratase/isomerase family protein [Pseudomonadota bacterium]
METLLVRQEGAVCIVTLNRPDFLNAFNARVMDELTDAFTEAASNPAVRVLVLTGAGRAFSAGADLSGRDRDYQARHGLAGMLDSIVDFPKPFLLAVNGLGVGIGATICGLADFTYMADNARLRCPFSALGLTAEAGSTVTFPNLMGRQRANWFLLAAEWMTATECLEAGLALELHPPESLMNRVLEQANKLATLPPASVQKTKAVMMAPYRETLKANIKLENAGLDELRGGPANIEAMKAFLEKREPDFSGIS